MFSSLHVPSVQGRRAVLVMNCQKDAFDPNGPQIIPNPPDFIERIRKVIPYYRRIGTDVVWVKTEIRTLAPAGSNGGSVGDAYDMAAYLPSSTAKRPKKSAEVSDILSKLTIDGEDRPAFKKLGPNNDLVDELACLVDEEKDLLLTKSYYSAFDDTPLLMALRMRMVTNIHLCGALSNASIISTAADAAQHGFEVSVLEDCMGYRSERQHLEAMQKMADELGVQGVDSEEIVDEAGGRPPPDAADPTLFLGPGLNGINISSDTDAKITASITDEQPETRTPEASATPRSRSNYKKRSRSRWTSEPHTGSIAEGDTHLHLDALSADLKAHAFDSLKEEVEWQTMKHRTGEVPRRVAVQGVIGEDGSVPVYRHPADESPPLTEFSENIRRIRDECSSLLGQPFNHVLVQLYRDGQDNISEHSDKTLDIVRGSSIVNVSLGAQRVMTMRLKRAATNRLQRERDDGEENGLIAAQAGQDVSLPPHADLEQTPALTSTPTSPPKQNGPPRESQKIPLPHASVFVLGPKSNARWLHGIRPDKRIETERSEAEKAFGGQRISLTFRNIGTFTDADRTLIWGQGARGKSRPEAGTVLKADCAESEKMLIAFGKENQMPSFDWEKEYGSGFDVLDLIVNTLEA